MSCLTGIQSEAYIIYFLHPLQNNSGFAHLHWSREMFVHFFYYFCIFRHANPSRNIDTLQKVPKLAQIPASKLQLIRLKLILNLLSKILSWNITANERGDSLCPVLAISWGLPFTSINSIPAISPNEKAKKEKNKSFSYPSASKLNLIWSFYNEGRYLNPYFQQKMLTEF